MDPYYSDDSVTLYHGDMRVVLPELRLSVDCIVADPPYGETSLAWDRWPDGWPTVAATVASSMWCFGSMRMFLDRRDEFIGWRLSQDVVWEKQNGTGFAKDRFRRVHEFAVHWYRGQWDGVYKDPVRERSGGQDKSGLARDKTRHTGAIGAHRYEDDGTRLVRSIIRVFNLHGRSQHPTEKPAGILDPLIRYACPPGGTVLDPFAGSGSTAVAARLSGRKAVLIEADKKYCEVIANRLRQDVLPVEAV